MASGKDKLNRNLIRRSFVLDSGNIGQRVAVSSGYKIVGIVLRTAITIASTAVLARLLSPADFGYMAMASVLTEFAALFGVFGFTNVLIQRRVITRIQLDTVFWATLIVGCLLAAIVVGLSYFSNWLFSDPRVAPLLRALSLSFVFNSLTAVPWVVLSRHMQFDIEFWAQIGVAMLRALTAILCAYAGLGVWSLVIGGLVGTAGGVMVNFLFVPYVPRFRFYLPLLTRTWRTSMSYFGSNVLYFLNMNLDLLLIGRQLGATSLGYYQNARSLTDEIRARIAMPLQHVLFPAFATVQMDLERFRSLVMRASRLLGAVVIPVGCGVSANATELVLVLYGAQWQAMIPIMSMFGLSAAIRAATAIASPLFNATNQVALALRYNAVCTILFIIAVVFAMPYGINAVALAVVISSLYALVSFRAAFALIGLTNRHIGMVLGMPTLAALVMWLVTAYVLHPIGTAIFSHTSTRLLFQVAAGCVTYIVVLHMLSRQYLIDFKQAISSMMHRS